MRDRPRFVSGLTFHLRRSGPGRPEDQVAGPVCGGAEVGQVGVADAETDPRHLLSVPGGAAQLLTHTAKLTARLSQVGTVGLSPVDLDRTHRFGEKGADH